MRWYCACARIAHAWVLRIHRYCACSTAHAPVLRMQSCMHQYCACSTAHAVLRMQSCARTGTAHAVLHTHQYCACSPVHALVLRTQSCARSTAHAVLHTHRPAHARGQSDCRHGPQLPPRVTITGPPSGGAKPPASGGKRARLGRGYVVGGIAASWARVRRVLKAVRFISRAAGAPGAGGPGAPIVRLQCRGHRPRAPQRRAQQAGRGGRCRCTARHRQTAAATQTYRQGVAVITGPAGRREHAVHAMRGVGRATGAAGADAVQAEIMSLQGKGTPRWLQPRRSIAATPSMMWFG